ncbi:MAG: UbiA family prenyltransferase [Acidobacteria bacterium]|nr:UbiA family prenyltransferase [Acidobacteriota bacterium]
MSGRPAIPEPAHRRARGALAALHHMRPRSGPVVAGHLLAGAAAAASPEILLERAPWILAAAVFWSVGLNGGTLALNSAVDGDEGDVGYLDAPPPVPRGLAVFGVSIMVAALALSYMAARAGYVGELFPLLLGGSLILSILYSVPPIRLKARAGYDMAVNCAGYGGITFLAGAAATTQPLDVAVLWAGTGFAFLFASVYPLTQIYQMEEDARQGVRTLAVRLGRRGSLLLATVAAASALTCLALGIMARHPQTPLWAVLPLVLPVTLWMRVLLPHLVSGGMACDKKTMYAGLRAWAVTDLVAALALMPGLMSAVA